MKLITIGFGSVVSSERIIAIVSPESAPIKRMIQEAKAKNTLVDATYGRKTKSVIITDSSYVIISALGAEELSSKIEEG